MRRRMGWDELRQDLRFGWRQLRRTPSFGVVAVLTLALAIGANTAVFSVVNGVLLRPLPYDRPDEVVAIWTRYLPPSGFDIPRFALSGPEILDYRESTRALARVGVFVPDVSRTLTGDGLEAERLSVTLVSADVLPVLGVRPVVGRGFTPDDDVAGRPSGMILSHDLWTGRFGADPAVVGRTLQLNGTATEVIGVMPEGFSFGSTAQAWLPLGLDRSNEGGRFGHAYYGVGRMAPGMTLADVDEELAVLSDRWAAEYEHHVAHFVWAEDAMAAAVGEAPRRMLLLLMVAVGLVLLIACVNVANLLLVRGERRHGEIALRMALGAGRGRVVRQLATESVTIAVLSAVIGVGIAWFVTPRLIDLAPTALPRLASATVDGTVLLFTAGVTVVTVLLFGVMPAFMSGRRALARMASFRPGWGRGGVALRRALVSGEVALSLVVVVLAGLLVRSYAALGEADRGLDTTNLLTFSVSLPAAAYPDDHLVPARLRDVLEGIRGIPGVAAVSAGNMLPFDGSPGQWDFELDDRPAREGGDQAWNATVALVAPGYFETLGIPLVAGRGIERQDDERAPWIGVVSETFARTYWPGERAVGKRWGYGQSEDSVTWITVAGVARDPVTTDVSEEPYPMVWIPAAQAGLSAYGWPRTYRVAVRTGSDPAALVPAVRDVVRAFDADLPLFRVQTMEDAVSASLARPRLATTLLGLFAALALLLASVGVYGVVAYSVASRTREIGVRVALGAPTGRVVRVILREGVTPVVVGIALGLAGAWVSTALVRSMLFGVAPTDRLTFVAVPVTLLAVGMLASWIPARRATTIAPTEALRVE